MDGSPAANAQAAHLSLLVAAMMFNRKAFIKGFDDTLILRPIARIFASIWNRVIFRLRRDADDLDDEERERMVGGADRDVV